MTFIIYSTQFSTPALVSTLSTLAMYLKHSEWQKSAECKEKGIKLTPREHLQQASSHHPCPHKPGRTLIPCSLPSLSTHLQVSKLRLILDNALRNHKQIDGSISQWLAQVYILPTGCESEHVLQGL